MSALVAATEQAHHLSIGSLLVAPGLVLGLVSALVLPGVAMRKAASR